MREHDKRNCECAECRLERIEENQEIMLDLLHGLAEQEDNDALLRAATRRLREHRQQLEKAVDEAADPK